MDRIRSALLIAGLGATLIGLAAAPALEAQAYLMPETPRKGLWFEAAHPDLRIFDVTLASSAEFLSGRYPVNARLYAVGEVPFAYGDLDVPGSPSLDGKTVLGNPYVGVEYAATDRIELELGLRLPLTTANESSFGDVVGAFSDLMRLEAFLDEVVPVSGALNLRHTLQNGPTLRARGGVTSVIWTGEEDEGESITFLDYGVFGHYPIRSARLGAGVAGRWDISEEEGGFSENAFHHLGLSGDVRIGRFRPGLNVRLPLDEDYRDMVRSSIGLYLQFALR